MARVAKTWTVVLGLGAALAALAVTTASAQGRPRLVKDIEQRSSDRVIPDHLTAVGDILYFTDSDGEHGTELWRSDGTAAGTSMVADVNPGPMSANPAQLTALDGLVFFVADDGTHGAELWVSDGSADGTALVADIHPGPGGSSPSFLTPVGDGLVFAADDGSSGIELWATDGTPEGTHRVVDIKPGPGRRSRNRWWRGTA